MFFNNSSAVLGSFLSHQSIKNFWSRQIIIEFNWIDFCNLLGRVCKHSLLKSSSNTPRKWNDYITSAGPLVGNRCWIQPAGRAKACETNGWHHSCLSDVFFWETSRQIGLHYPDFRSISENLVVRFKVAVITPQFFRWTKTRWHSEFNLQQNTPWGPQMLPKNQCGNRRMPELLWSPYFPCTRMAIFQSTTDVFFVSHFAVLENRKGTYIAGMLKLRFQKIRVTAGTVLYS